MDSMLDALIRLILEEDTPVPTLKDGRIDYDRWFKWAEEKVAALRGEVAALKEEMATARKFSVLRENMNLKKELTALRERYELERIRYEGISAANEELRSEVDVRKVEYAAMKAANNALQEEVARLRSAVEWAYNAIHTVHEAGVSTIEFEDELRRRAGEG